METTTDRDEPTKADLTVSGIPRSDFTMIESTGTMGLGQWVQRKIASHVFIDSAGDNDCYENSVTSTTL